MSLGKENYHILGAGEFDKMKPGALVINTSRGGLIDEEALVKALRDKKIAGAAIDVFEEEPYRGPLLEFTENTILTPHVASFAGTYRYDIEKETMDNMIEGLKKKGMEV
jgi:D-3-phosphoglycerate dehydrogenase